MATKSGVWRACLSDLLLAAGALLLLGAALMWSRSALAAQETANRRYLAASVPLALPLPDDAGFAPLAFALPSPTPASPKEQSAPENQAAPAEQAAPTKLAAEPGEVLASSPTARPTDAVATVTPPPPAPPTIAPSPIPPTIVPTSLPPVEQPPEVQTPVVTELPASNPVVHLEIPTLKVKRAVVPIGIRPDSSGAMSWDTDAIFATNNRPDLVGHLVGSAYPGQGGNVILVGHNYNQVDYGWEGVFVNIKTMQPGDRIVIRGEDGREYAYIVQQVKQVPWRSKNAKELEKHLKYLGPVKSERLTLVTCGGANIWPFPARVYVIAVPEGE